MKTRKIALLVGMAAAIAAAVEPSTVETARVEGGSTEPEAARPIGILIMAVGRSGSTMVGELFQQNKVRILRNCKNTKRALFIL